MLTGKSCIADLKLFGGSCLFEKPRSTSNLVRPNIETFLAYSRVFHDAGQYTNNGPLVRQLEYRLAQFHGTRHCISTCNGFWALVMAIHCLALPGRSEVVMPSLTYRRLGDAVSWAGLMPRYCEVDPATLAISPATATPHVGNNTALVLGVHPIVNCCDAPGLEHMVARHALPLLFDSVESMYETIDGRKIGSFGQAECFSMHASKLVNGFEGGYLTTNDDHLAERLAKMRGFSFSGPDRIIGLGSNAKLNEIHAAMALAGLDELEQQVAMNRHRYRAYEAGLAGMQGIRLLPFNESERCSFKNIVVELTEDWPLSRADTLVHLNAEGVLARAYYSPPLHKKPTIYPVVSESLPITERLATRFVLMPCGFFTDESDIAMIMELLEFLRRHANEIKRAHLNGKN